MVKVVLGFLILFAVFRVGDKIGLLNQDAWFNFRRDGELRSALFFGLILLMFVFGEELDLRNNVDENGRAIENDERSERASNRTIVLILLTPVIATALFYIIRFLQ